MKSKIKILFATLLSVLLFTQCNFLDVVPDNTVEIEHMFENREVAIRALATVYRYMPDFEGIHNSMVLAGDEWLGRLDPYMSDGVHNLRGIRLMRGLNNSSSPTMNFWAHGGGVNGLYRGIRMANIFLQHIDNVPDMSSAERLDWIAQVEFLKAYYHFWLIRLYGPIVIADRNLEPYDPVEAVRQERATIDESFEYVINLMTRVIAEGNLPPVRPASYLGQIDQQIAKAALAKVKLTRASPLFNGNSEFFSNFRGVHGELLFPMEYRRELWKEALVAIEQAIAFAHENGRELFTFQNPIPFWDADDFEHSDVLRYVYNNRFSIVDAWNTEMVWGFSGIRGTSQGAIAHGSNIRPWDNQAPEFAWQWLGSTFRMVEVFHTRNGLPIGDDITFPYDDRFELRSIPADSWHRGVMQPGRTTVELHLNREPRFYAWMGVDGMITRLHNRRVNIGMMHNEFNAGLQGMAQLGSRGGHTTDFFWSGIAVTKQVHPESLNQWWMRIVRHAPPIIRLADLYLMFAEAYNEYYGPGQSAFDKLDAVRARAGLRGVQETWSDATIASPRVLNTHLTREGLRAIIHREREIELSFEGHRFFDVLRWKRAGELFNTPQRGWNTMGVNAQQFYILQTLQERTFQTPRDYFMPIPLVELNRNPNLVQNPGW